MLPYLLAAVGGYLIGDSMKSQSFADGGKLVADGNIKIWESVKRKFSEVFFEEDDGNEIYSNQVKMEEYQWMFDRYSKYASPLSWEDAKNKFLGMLTPEEKAMISIEYDIKDIHELFGVMSYKKILVKRMMSDGGKLADGGTIYQIKDPKKRFYSISMSTGKPAWNESADLGYRYTKEDAEKLKEVLSKQGYSDLEIVEYDKDWWKYADDEIMAKGGTIGDAARVKPLNKTGVIMKVFKANELEQFSDMPRENYYYLKFADGSEGTYGKSELEIFKN